MLRNVSVQSVIHLLRGQKNLCLEATLGPE